MERKLKRLRRKMLRLRNKCKLNCQYPKSNDYFDYNLGVLNTLDRCIYELEQGMNKYYL